MSLPAGSMPASPKRCPSVPAGTPRPCRAQGQQAERAGSHGQWEDHSFLHMCCPTRQHLCEAKRAGWGCAPQLSPFVMKSQACVPESSPCGRSHPSPLEISILSLLLGCRGVWLQRFTEQFTSSYRSQKDWEDFSSGFLQPKPTSLNYNLGSISLVGSEVSKI